MPTTETPLYPHNDHPSDTFVRFLGNFEGESYYLVNYDEWGIRIVKMGYDYRDSIGIEKIGPRSVNRFPGIYQALEAAQPFLALL